MRLCARWSMAARLRRAEEQAMSMIVFRYLHFLGITFWIGTAVAVAVAASAPTPWESGIAQALRKVTIRVTTPSMLFAFAGGFGMLIPNFRRDVRDARVDAREACVLVLALAGAHRACSPGSFGVGGRAKRSQRKDLRAPSLGDLDARRPHRNPRSLPPVLSSRSL